MSVLGNSDTRTLVTSRTQPRRVREVKEGQRRRMLSTTDWEICSDASQFLPRDCELFLSSFTKPLMVSSVVWLPRCFKKARTFFGPNLANSPQSFVANCRVYVLVFEGFPTVEDVSAFAEAEYVDNRLHRKISQGGGILHAISSETESVSGVREGLRNPSHRNCP